MSVEYPGALDFLVDEQRVFIGQNSHEAIVVHKTASPGQDAQAVGRFFQTNSAEHSTHFVVGRDGTIVQCVLLKDGAGGDCCADAGHDPFWDPMIAKYGNLNLCTISIEFVDDSDQNATPLTGAQQEAGFKLIQWLMRRYNIPQSHIKGHSSIAPVRKPLCPNVFPWVALWAFLAPEPPPAPPAPPAPAQPRIYTQEMVECWNSFFAQTLKQPAPALHTGICDDWMEAWAGPHYNQFGPPITHEYTSKDFLGNEIICQQFAGGRCEWNPATNTPHWFDAWGEVSRTWCR
jgi:hypothetical protein